MKNFRTSGLLGKGLSVTVCGPDKARQVLVTAHIAWCIQGSFCQYLQSGEPLCYVAKVVATIFKRENHTAEADANVRETH